MNVTEEELARFDAAFYGQDLQDGNMTVELLQSWVQGLGFRASASELQVGVLPRVSGST